MTLNSKDAIFLLTAIALGAVVGIAGVLIGQNGQGDVSAAAPSEISFCSPGVPFEHGTTIANGRFYVTVEKGAIGCMNEYLTTLHSTELAPE